MQPGFVLIVGAGAALYIASRAAADALRGTDKVLPGRMVLGFWLPIAAVALGAMFLNRPEVAIGVIFATSVASLSLIVGVVSFLSPPRTPTVAKKLWPTLVPAAMLVFLAGFRSELNYLHAIVLVVEGLALLWVWRNPELRATRLEDYGTARNRFTLLRGVQLTLAIALAGIGAWAGVRGTERVSQMSEVASAGLLSASLLSPLLVLPMLGAGIDLAHRGESAFAITSQIAVALLNLCVLLPLIIAVGYLRKMMFDAATPQSLPIVQRLFHAEAVSTNTVQFPLAMWRVDVVALIALGLFLLPVSQGKWTLSKGNGLALIGGYAAYLLLATAMGVRMV